MKPFLKEKVKKRVCITFASRLKSEQMNLIGKDYAKLEQFFHKSVIPKEIGGEFSFDVNRWIDLMIEEESGETPGITAV